MKCAAAAALVLLVVADLPCAYAQPATAASGSFTKEQAQRGKALYDMRCASCHGAELIADDATAPDMTGQAFRLGWQGQTLAARFDLIRSGMPPGRPQMLTDQEYLDVVTYILSFNGYPAGKDELKPDLERLKQIVIEPPAAPVASHRPGEEATLAPAHRADPVGLAAANRRPLP